jgi:hypothetical protein
MTVEKFSTGKEDDADWWELLGDNDRPEAKPSVKLEASQLRQALSQWQVERDHEADPVAFEQILFRMRREQNAEDKPRTRSRIARPRLAIAASILCVAIALPLAINNYNSPQQATWDESQWITKAFRIPDPVSTTDTAAFKSELQSILESSDIAFEAKTVGQTIHLRALLTSPTNPLLVDFLTQHNIKVPPDYHLWLEIPNK